MIFLLTCLLALVVHGTIWRNLDFIDERMWTAHLAAIGRGDFEAANRLLYTYPAGPLMMIALAAHSWFNVPVRAALAGSMALLNAVFIGGAVVVSRKLDANSWWWLGAGGLLIFNRLYLRATPPTIIAIPMIVLLLLIFMAVRRWRDRAGGWLLLWGIILGFTIATRYDIGAYTGLALGVFLIKTAGWEKAIKAAGIAMAVSIIFNPYFWLHGPRHYLDAVLLILYHFNDYSNPTTLKYSSIFRTSPLAILGVMTVALWSLVAKKYLPFSRGTAWALLLMTLGFTVIVKFSQLQSVRYLFPLMVLWEIIVLWCVFHALWLIERMKIHAGKIQLALIALILSVQIYALMMGYLD